MKLNFLYFVFIILLLILTFGMFDNSDNIKSVELDDSTIGYYQSTTCKISLLEFYFQNFNKNKTLYINQNNYADLNCFGKITGVDKIDDTYFVSVGTNTSGNLIVQSLIWLSVFMLIPKKREFKSINIKYIVSIPFLFLFQHFSENRFYKQTNILYDNEITITNYYLWGNFLFFLLLVIIIKDLVEPRLTNIINYVPFVFLIPGTFSGMNINFYLIILCFFGVVKLNSRNCINIYDVIYFVFSIVWVLNIDNNDFFFDGDKLRGFTNSVLNTQSQLFWIIVFYLVIKGLIYLVEASKDSFSYELFIKNSLISGSLVSMLGIFGSLSSFGNFFNYYFFGQNKRGMKEFSSIAGNTWRGFSPSAESLGEFYGFIILLLFLYIFKYKTLPTKYYSLLIIPIIYGLYRSNNFAAISSLIIISTLSVLGKTSLYKKYKIYLILSILIIGVSGLFTFTQVNTYSYLSTELLYEATLHQNFYPGSDNYESYLKVEKKMIERDLNSILLDKENKANASSTYKFLVNLITVKFNFPLIPNVVAFVSVIAFLINRTEMWGIFIAKYNPSISEVIFGKGPLQLNDYLYSHKIRLDVPKENLDSLYLPHSSVLNLYMFFGVFGLVLFIISLYVILKKFSTNNIFGYLTIFLILNFLKSDSMLYMQSVILFILTFLLLGSIREKEKVD
tara:strand:- start:136 stop:2160 length:2025 start_codon:yes stop_codon:yes gene_type:complete